MGEMAKYVFTSIVHVVIDDVSARHAQGRLLGEILGELLVKLGAPNSALRSLAYVQVS
jgi:hypothetical protein